MDNPMISQLLQDVGRIIDLAEITEFEDHWLIRVDEILDITLETAQDEAVFLWANIAEIPNGCESTAQRLALQANGLFSDHGGFTLALEGANQRLQLILKLALNGVDAASLAAVLENFQERCRAWRGALQELAEGHQPPSTPGDLHGGMIRV